MTPSHPHPSPSATATPLPAPLRRLLEAGSYQGPDGPEVELPQGDVTVGVVRVGDTVRRPRQRTSAAVASYLLHLERVGFEGAPRFLGTDAAGRDVLEFIPGRTAGPVVDDPRMADENLLASVSVLARRLMEASVGHPLSVGDEPWFADLLPDPPGTTPLFRPMVVAHSDLTPQNVVVDDANRARALIDFDLAGPSTLLREAANIAFHWAQPGPRCDRHPAFAALDETARLVLIADAIGLDDRQRRRLPEFLTASTFRSRERMRRAAQDFGGGWARMWDEGVGDTLTRRHGWLTDHQSRLEAALSD